MSGAPSTTSGILETWTDADSPVGSSPGRANWGVVGDHPLQGGDEPDGTLGTEDPTVLCGRFGTAGFWPLWGQTVATLLR
jgi:hypothetical protein